ncbi:MAG: GNAT family N-acetyltransferase [bacterium]|jgi:predicted N-acetyltransferase YhbS|nr:GNAT family N-acetyltransferase [bacterium]
MINEPQPLGSPPEPVEKSLVVDSSHFHQALDLLEEAFPDVSRGFFYAIVQQDPWYNPNFSLGLEKGDRLVAFLQIFDRTLQLGGRTVRVGGIGSVATRPKEQGQGYSTRLLNQAIEMMEQHGMESSILFTKIHPFYERLGWRTLPQFEQEIPVAALKALRPSYHAYRRILEKDCQPIQEIYSLQSHKTQGNLVRTPAYWDARVHWMNHTPIAVLDEERLVGYFYYARYNLKKPVLAISEMGLRESDDKTVALVLGAMARKAEECGCTAIRGFFRPVPGMNRYLDSSPGLATDHPHHYVMWRDLGAFEHHETILELIAQNRFLYWQTDAF